MTVASSFERRLTDTVINFTIEATSEKHLLVWLVRNKAVSRQYHTWFDWNKRNANKFFGLFGPAFRNYAKSIVNEDDDLQSSIRSFLEIGDARNRLVHQDFGSFTLEKTSEEIYSLYSSASKFVDWIPHAIKQYVEASNRPE